MKIKICGLTRQCDIDYVNELLPDYIGFVFAKKSKRYITPIAAAELRRRLSPDIAPVGVFVNEPIENILNCIKIGATDIIQLHGDEDNQYIESLKNRTKAPVIKAFKINDKTEKESINNSKADLVLLDNGYGEGKTFDWGLAKNIERPYFLAGGLSVENAKDAISLLHPYGIDVSSGVEENGTKSYDKIKEFIKTCKNGG